MPTFIRAFGVSRVLFGLWLIAMPTTTARMWFGPAGPTAPVQVLARSVGSRDVALGLALAADHAHPQRWLAAGLLADLTDGLAMLLVRREIPSRNVWLGAGGALSYALIGALLRRRDVGQGAG